MDWEGLKIIRIGEKIEEFLQDQEDNKPKHRRRKVYCAKHIAENHLAEG